MGKRELIALLNLSSWCLVMVERLFLAVPWGCLQFVIVVFPDHTHLLFFYEYCINMAFADASWPGPEPSVGVAPSNTSYIWCPPGLSPRPDSLSCFYK